MLRHALGFGVALVVAVGSAQADDHPPIWTGLYGGVSLGYGFGDNRHSETDGTLSVSDSWDVRGAIGGVHLGGQRQFGQFVAGIEIGVNGAGIDGSKNGFCLNPTAPGATASCSASVDWSGTGLVRGGYALGNTHIYATGGWMFAGHDVSRTGAPGSIASRGTSGALSGPAYGLGVEMKLTSALVVGLEYLHAELDGTGGGVRLDGLSSKDLDLDIVRGRISLMWGAN